jgi:hypothetical protein
MEFDRFDNPIYTTEELVAQLYESQEWIDFRETFDMNDEGNQTLLGLLFDEKLCSGSGPDPELADYQRLLKLIIAGGGVVRVKKGQFEFIKVPMVEEVVEAEVPRDKNGNPLSESQSRWSEYRTFSESHSMAECKQRAKTDAGYGSFFRKQYERETGEVGDRVENLNQREQVSAPPAEALVAWAAEYHRTPTEKLRQLKRFDTNPYGAAEWNRKFEACVSAGLI